MSDKVNLAIHGPVHVWNVKVEHETAVRIQGCFKGKRPIEFFVKADGPFAKESTLYHFNPEMIVAIEVTDELFT